MMMIMMMMLAGSDSLMSTVQCVDGLKFMFPKAMAKLEREGKHAKVFALHKAVAQRPRIKSYLESPRRQKYSLGIYRYYKELDFEG